jgi:hypothetical protein
VHVWVRVTDAVVCWTEQRQKLACCFVCQYACRTLSILQAPSAAAAAAAWCCSFVTLAEVCVQGVVGWCAGSQVGLYVALRVDPGLSDLRTRRSAVGCWWACRCVQVDLLFESSSSSR